MKHKHLLSSTLSTKKSTCCRDGSKLWSAVANKLHVGLYHVGECWLGSERSHGPLIHAVIQNIEMHHPFNY